jgi:hypothetical protein
MVFPGRERSRASDAGLKRRVDFTALGEASTEVTSEEKPLGIFMLDIYIYGWWFNIWLTYGYCILIYGL